MHKKWMGICMKNLALFVLSQNNCICFVNRVLQNGGMSQGWNSAGIVFMGYDSCLLLPSRISLLIWGESFVYRVLRKNSSVHNVAVTQFCNALVLTSSSSASASTTTSPFFSIPCERVTSLFFRLSLCKFLSRSLGFLELFSTFPFECLWPPFLLSSLPPSHPETHLIWVDSSLMTTLQLSLVCDCLWPPLTQSSIPTWLSGQTSDQWTWSGQPPLTFMQFSPLIFFLGRSMLIVYGTFSVYCLYLHHILFPDD